MLPLEVGIRISFLCTYTFIIFGHPENKNFSTYYFGVDSYLPGVIP